MTGERSDHAPDGAPDGLPLDNDGRHAAAPRRAGTAPGPFGDNHRPFPPRDSADASSDDGAPRGPYDPDPDAPDDAPWFVAPLDYGDPDAHDPDAGHGGAADMPPWAQPGPRADRRAAAADRDGDRAGDWAGDWAGAEAGHAAALARAALAVGALDDRVRTAGGAATRTPRTRPDDPAANAANDPTGPPTHSAPGSGLRRRLLCAEIADLAWHLGDRVTVDRLALYLVLRLPGMGAHAADEAQALARAAWAWRRLDHGAAPPLDDPPALAAWLGRAPAATRDAADPALIGRPVGTEFDALAQDWARGVAAQADRHPFVQAAAAWQGWRARGLSGDTAEIEGAVLASRIAACALRPGGLGFVPLGLGGGAALRAGGDTGARLAAWLAGIESAALRGLMDCDRLTAWTAQARDLTAPMSGRTPERLVRALAAWPIVSAPMLAAQTRASRAAVQRNMIRFEDLGLVRELTGQSRFRFWRAAL